jgi:hypothetical protein
MKTQISYNTHCKKSKAPSWYSMPFVKSLTNAEEWIVLKQNHTGGVKESGTPRFILTHTLHLLQWEQISHEFPKASGKLPSHKMQLPGKTDQ